MEKKYFVLDLDETLISGIPKKQKHTLKKLENYNMDNYYTIYCRPHLQEFLDYVFEHFNVIIWTAASKDYCLFIVKNIVLKNPNRKIKPIIPCSDRVNQYWLCGSLSLSPHCSTG